MMFTVIGIIFLSLVVLTLLVVTTVINIEPQGEDE